MLGADPLLGQALQNSWDKPALGTCHLKCLGQARSWSRLLSSALVKGVSAEACLINMYRFIRIESGACRQRHIAKGSKGVVLHGIYYIPIRPTKVG